MKTIFFVVAMVFCGSSLPCPAEAPKAPPAKEKGAGVKYEGGDGSSMEKAIVIKGAKNSEVGIAAEYAWVREHHRGYRMKRQSLRSGKDGKRYDVLEIVTSEGKEVEVYFEITEFFGKF